MKTKSEQKNVNDPIRVAERGNALIYVLIVIVLFAALSFTLMRQGDDSQSSGLSDEKAELYATQIISYAAQARSAVQQMLFTASTKVSELDFTTPNEANFDTGALIHKIYHPQGGGLTAATLHAPAISQTTTDPQADWYFGEFNNVDWSKTAANDVILVAYQIAPKVCGLINKKVNGTTTIPTITAPIRNVMIDAAHHSGANVAFTTDTGEICSECRNMASLCVQEGGIYAFYTIIADQ